MKTFEQIKNYIVTEAEKEKACSSQLYRAKNAESIDDLLTVVKDNLSWVSGNGLFNGITISDFFTDEKLIEHGLYNSGEGNSGFGNTGDSNTGYSNTGDRNTGDRNTGDRNTGDRNTGDRNTGDRNTGYWNTGDSNTGDSNTGYSNTGNRNTGAFCTGDPGFPMFNKPSEWSEQDFLNSLAYDLLCSVDTKQWVPSYAMSDEEKAAHPSHETCGGYLKDIPFKQAFGDACNNWSEENRKAFISLPNFDKDIFFEITGVDVKN